MINAISAADVKFDVCLVTKPLGVFSSETKWLKASLVYLIGHSPSGLFRTNANNDKLIFK